MNSSSFVSLKINCPDFEYEAHAPSKEAREYHANHVKEEAAMTNLSYEYSGRHDHGSLEKLNETGYYANLIQALQEMKSETDLILQKEVTKQMNQSKDEEQIVENELLGSEELDNVEEERVDDNKCEGNENEISKKPRLR